VKCRGQEHGYTLPEALVALALLSMGLGTTTLMLVQAIRHEREAACRTAAVRTAGSLAEQLRLLRRSDGRPLQAVVAPGEPADCATADDCDAELKAARMLSAWRASASAGLPEGSSSQVEVLGEIPPSYLIRIQWPDLGSAAGSTLQLVVEP
jgi:Tfp pilus assembly protein PilV